MDPPSRTRTHDDPRRPSARKMVLCIAAAAVVASVVFGVSTLRGRDAYERYKARTLVDEGPPWTHTELSVDACIAFAVDWGVSCPGLESWCVAEAPALARKCFASADRHAYCASVADEVKSTRFGVQACEALRVSIEGRHAQRAHKKYCAAAHRSLAAHCVETLAEP
jgi:hypothetical protein